jgi:hypothetical protein
MLAQTHTHIHTRQRIVGIFAVHAPVQMLFAQTERYAHTHHELRQPAYVYTWVCFVLCIFLCVVLTYAYRPFEETECSALTHNELGSPRVCVWDMLCIMYVYVRVSCSRYMYMHVCMHICIYVYIYIYILQAYAQTHT